MNFRGILSKSSSKSSSSGKSLAHSEEVLKLQTEIESLRETIDTLKFSVESRDAAIGTLAREKEKIFIELKSAQRTNRNVHQQLIDERDIHSKEKEFLMNEIKRLTNRSEHEIDAQQNIETCENIIFLLEANRKTLDTLLDNLLKSSTVPPNSKKYLNLLQMNADLHYENTQLNIYLSAKDSTDLLNPEFIRSKAPSDIPFIREKITTKSPFTKTMYTVARHRTARSKLKPLMNHARHVNSPLYRSASDSCILWKN